MGLLNLLDFSKVAQLIVEYDLYTMFLDIEGACTQNDFLNARESLIASVFVEALKLLQLGRCLHIATVFESNLL